MDYNKLKEFRFWDTIDSVLHKPVFGGTRRPSLYPSEASVVGTDPKTGEKKVLGTCQRKAWYRLMGFRESNPSGTKSKYIMEFGKQLENFICDLAKKGFIYHANSIKLWEPELLVSGEIDIVVEHPQGGLVFIEAKSSYGPFKEKQLMDHYEGRGQYRKLVKGKPDDSHVMQLALYLWNNRFNQDLLGGKLVYILRDNMTRTEFDIVIAAPDATGRHKILINGEPEPRYYMEDVFARYQYMVGLAGESFAKLNQGTKQEELTPPERDYELVYTDERITEGFKEGDISKTAFEAWDKDNSKRPGDWQCSYCGHKDRCWTAEAIAEHVGAPARRNIQKRLKDAA